MDMALGALSKIAPPEPAIRPEPRSEFRMTINAVRGPVNRCVMLLMSRLVVWILDMRFRHTATAAACFAATSALSWIPPCAAQSPATVRRLSSGTNLARKIDPIVEAGRSELRLPEVSIAIMRGQKLVFTKGYGSAERETGVAPSERTIYPIGSLSKQFTAAAIMKLEEGRVRLDDPLATHLPEYHATQNTN